MSSNEKPIFWASSSRLNEPESILKEQGWHKGSRPAASDFNWLFNTMQKDLHAAKMEIKELKEKLEVGITGLNQQVASLKASTAKIKETADHAQRDSHSNQTSVNMTIRNFQILNSNLNVLMNELKKIPARF